MATDYFADAQRLTRAQEFPETADDDADEHVRRDSDAPQDHRLAQFLGGLSIGLGLVQLLAPRTVSRAVGAGNHPGLMRLLGVREITSGLGLLSRRQPGRWSWARVAGDVMDLALLGAAASSPRADRQRLAITTAAVAGVAALDAYAARRLHGVEALQSAAVLVNQTITVNADPQTVYDFWSRFENLPRFMRHLEEVKQIDDRVSHWVARAPAGTRVEWDSEIVADQPNRRIAWRTLPGSQVEHEGTVDFNPAPGGRGTHLRVTLRYVPPLGPIAVPIARLFGEEPRLQINDDLRRFKQLIETGEVATTTGQPAGRRSVLGRSTLGRWLS